jgi:acetylornithine deacetylase/succinyl-diaminopimelate desuccinylase-like protein
MVAERQRCWIRATICSAGCHVGILPRGGDAMANLGKMLIDLDKKRLPVHITPVADVMLKKISSSLGVWKGFILSLLTNPMFTNPLLNILGEKGDLFYPLLHNTVAATVIRAGEQINQMPGEISVELDGRILPGYGPDDIISELREIIANDIKLEVIRFDPGPGEPGMGLFDTIADILHQTDPGGIPVPSLLSASTDAKHFSRLGIQTYGFLPMQLPEDMKFHRLIHGADERIPVEALHFGAKVQTAMRLRWATGFKRQLIYN